MSDDSGLLKQYLAERSDAAFERIAHAYGGMVYAAARRQVPDEHMAEDVVQAVFLLLMKKAPALTSEHRLGGWLIRTTHFVAREALRRERRRNLRETKAAQMDSIAASDVTNEAILTELKNVLDCALSRLKPADRDAVVLRFLSGKTVAEVATMTGVSDEAIRKRLQRALSKLRRQLALYGVNAAPALLPNLLHQAGQEGATELAAHRAAGAISRTTPAGHDLAKSVAVHLAGAKVGIAAGIALTFAAIIAAGVWTKTSQPARGAAPLHGNIYQTDNDGPVGDEWSAKRTTMPPTGAGGKFLGEFTSQPVTLSLRDLPKHDFVRISFDLLILISWDGSGVESPKGSIVGPDTWTLQTDGGRMLMWQTFSNTPSVPGFAREIMLQNYPSPVPGDKLPAQTGAAEKQTLGYIFAAGPGFPMDAVYHITMTIPHDRADIQLIFWGLGQGPTPLQKNGQFDESWGLRHVKIEVLPASQVKLLNEPEAVETLEVAIGSDVDEANAAFWQLARGGDAVRAAMRQAVAEAPVDHAQANRIIAEILAARGAKITTLADDFGKIGILAETDLWKAIERDPKPVDVRRRLDPIVRVLSRMQLTDRRERRAAVAARVLEIIGE